MGHIKKYIKVPADMATENYRVSNGLEEFNYGMTIYGEFFVDVNTLNTHPELFDGIDIEYVDIDYDDIMMYDEDGNVISKNYIKPSRIPYIKRSNPPVQDNEENAFIPMNKINWVQKLYIKVRNFFRTLKAILTRKIKR